MRLRAVAPTSHDLSATALSDDATPAASADVGPDMTMCRHFDG